jgi:hypothetical protein
MDNEIYLMGDPDDENTKELLKYAVLEYEVDCPRNGVDKAMNELMDQGVPCHVAYNLARETKKKLGIKHRRDTTLLCEHCRFKLGTKRCSKCYDKAAGVEVRYCGPECQLAAWPSHKAVCRAKK